MGLYHLRVGLVYGVEEGVAHLNQVIRPQLAVIDAIHCSGGAGPNRTTVEVDAIIASRDPVAADSVGCQVMGIDPRTVPQLKIAEGIGVGKMNSADIEVAGKQISEVYHKFLTPQEATRELVEGLDIDLILDAKACTGCQVNLCKALGTVREKGQSHLLKGLTVAAGKDVDKKVMGVDKEKLILVGNCTSRFKKRGRYVPGCPAYDFEILSELTGVEVPVWWGPDTDRRYEEYQKMVAAGAPRGFPWHIPP